jgi:arylsulfatase A-like enzyme
LAHSYLACISFVDAQVGRVVAALEEAGLTDETIIVVWSDHGYHLGEKSITGKNSLWEPSTRVPLLFAGPGVAAGQRCDQPAELLDIFPTLSELCRLPIPRDLEGLSLQPQLRDARTPRTRPALTTHNPGNHSVRSHRYRYIRYADGSEELYDHQVDPHEWSNLLAEDSVDRADHLQAIVKEHRSWLPTRDSPPAAGSAHRILTYDPQADEACWEGSLIKRSDPIPD